MAGGKIRKFGPELQKFCAGPLEKRLALDSILMGGSRLATAFQRDLALRAGDTATAPVPGIPLHVIVGDELIAANAGATPISALVMRIGIGIAAVLLVPFLAMGFFGRRHLVSPTRALARSRELLARQQTALKRKSDELRELAAIAELSRDAITVTDRDARIVWVPGTGGAD